MAPRSEILTDLLRSLDALRNPKAIVLLMASFAISLLLMGAGAASKSAPIFGLFAVLALLVFLVGCSAAGVVLMDVTREKAPLSIGDAIVLGGIASLKLIAGILGLILALVGVQLVIAILLYLCKIPGIGPLLYAVLLPAMLIFTALVYLGAGACFSLLAPALWDGNSMGVAFARVYAIGSQRPIQFIIAWLAALLLLAFVFVTIFGVLATATLSVGGLSAAILGAGISMPSFNPMEMFGGGYGMGRSAWGGDGGGGYVMAGVFGGALAWAVAFAAYGAVAVMAMCVIYVGLSEGLDTAQAEQSLAGQIAWAKQKAADVQETAKQRALQAQARAYEAVQRRAQSAATPPGAESGSPRCPSCNAPIEAASVFCGECGAKLG